MLGGVTKGYPEVGGDHQPLSDLNGKRSQRVVPRQPIGDNLLGAAPPWVFPKLFRGVGGLFRVKVAPRRPLSSLGRPRP